MTTKHHSLREIEHKNAARDNATLRSAMSSRNARSKKLPVSLVPLKCLEKKEETK
jgi:hypothetical protein